MFVQVWIKIKTKRYSIKVFLPTNTFSFLSHFWLLRKQLLKMLQKAAHKWDFNIRCFVFPPKLVNAVAKLPWNVTNLLFHKYLSANIKCNCYVLFILRGVRLYTQFHLELHGERNEIRRMKFVQFILICTEICRWYY